MSVAEIIDDKITPDSIYMGYRLGDLVAIAVLYKQNGNEPMDIVNAFRAGMEESRKIFISNIERTNNYREVPQ